MSSRRALLAFPIVLALACSAPPAEPTASGASARSPPPPAGAPAITAGGAALPSYRFWIGDVGPAGPLFSGPQQEPFLCTTYENGLGQPLVDNQDGLGQKVFPDRADGTPDTDADPVGYSRTCSLRTRVDYFYFDPAAQRFVPVSDPSAVPATAERITVLGKTVPFVVRLERGTINRFIYSVAMLAPYPEPLESPAGVDERFWNRKLVYSFQGGVGIGHYQGDFSTGRTAALHEQALRRGYAVAYSTGNVMDTHYNLVLAGETALMVKEHFAATYGAPRWTIGVGGSGGSIQQYAIAQNLPGLLDGLVPQYSYSDMVTQTIYVGDCELIERYADMKYVDAAAHGDVRSKWMSWSTRGLVEGLSTNPVANKAPWNANPFAPRPGSSECINGWRGLTPLVINPKWTYPYYWESLARWKYAPSVGSRVNWDHWDDLGNIYPKDDQGYAEITWDNVGVQYGLGALKRGELTTAEFLELNACVGAWKPSSEMTALNYPWNPAADPRTWDPWSTEDMALSPTCATGTPAPRRSASLAAMHAAYESGHVFRGDVDLPVVDMRHYLDPVLDMHHAQQSFATRQRMLEAKGDADNQVIWFAECSTLDPVTLSRSCAFDPTGAAFDVVDRWIANVRERPHANVAANRPHEAEDACFAGDGTLLYRGRRAWAGILDRRPPGPCTARFPLHTTSRIEAGGGIAGDVFKCALKSVDAAVADGTYGGVALTADERARLKEIFPDGVCDYSKPDVGRPAGP